MTYQEFLPGENLGAFVKCYYLSDYDTDEVVQDRAFATGSIELMFNLGSGCFQTGRGGRFEITPKLELWGQIIEPLDFRSLGKNKMLGIRFYPHTASLILGSSIDVFNNQVNDFAAIEGPNASRLHEQLLNASSPDHQMRILDSFLTSKLSKFQRKNAKFEVVNKVIAEMRSEDFCDNIQDIAFRYGISSRYIQKLFVEFTGISPKMYSKIARFQKSLVLTNSNNQKLTSIAYQAGYFDQSHFIRDFKLFTGVSPSYFDGKNSSAVLASPIS